MALEIGGGISIGGGITFREEVAPVIIPNTMTVANDSGSNYYGSDPYGYSGGPAGMMNSELIESLIVYWYDYSNPGSAYMRLKQGTHSNCTVNMNGSIDSDLHTFPRTFIINSTSYTFVFNEMMGSYIYNGNLGFPNLVGETINIVWDGLTPSVPSFSILVSAFEGYGMAFFGANNGYNSARNMQTGPIFGTVNHPVFNSLSYQTSPSGGSTYITLHDGDYGAMTINSGLINSDSTSDQVFTINNKRYSFSPMTGYNAGYMKQGDVGLMLATQGSVVSMYYDPTNQGGNGHTASGSLISGTNGMNLYGVVPGMMGSMSVIPNMLFTINFDQMQNSTTVVFKTGTYYGGIVVDDTLATIDGQTDVNITVYGVSRTGTLTSSGGGMGPVVTFSGDPFMLMSKQGVELTVTIDAVVPSNAVTYTASIDYSPGAQMPPGVYFIGSEPTYTVYLSQQFWYTPAGGTALHDLTTGGTFDVTMPLTGGTVYTITLLGTWQGSGPDYWTDVSSSSPLSLPGGSDSCPSTVSVASTGGVSGTTIAPTFTAAPSVISYSSAPYSLTIWYTSTSDAEYIAASTAGLGSVVSFSISGTEYRAIVDSVSTSTNNFYGPTGYLVMFSFSGAAVGYTMPPSGTPNTTPVVLYPS